MKEYNEKNAIKVMSKEMSRQQLKTFMMNLPPCLVGM